MTPLDTTTTSSATTADKIPDDAIVGSPLKKQRASVGGFDDEVWRRRLGSANLGEILGGMEDAQTKKKKEGDNVGLGVGGFGGALGKSIVDEDEEL